MVAAHNNKNKRLIQEVKFQVHISHPQDVDLNLKITLRTISMH